MAPLRFWLTPSWWRYLLTRQFRNGDAYWPKKPSWPTSLSHLICRIRNHPSGVVWYNVGGLEPDMTCRDCGDNLG